MNVKNNKRRQASVERIKQAFLELLKTKEPLQITVSELCKAAQINRSTFYANFADIFDLSDKICRDLEAEVNRIFVLPPDGVLDEAVFLALFRHIKSNQQLYTFYFKLGHDTHGLDFYNVRSIVDMPLIDYHIAFFKNGFNAIVKLWLEHGCEESPQQLCDILMKEYRGRFELHN